MTPTAAAFLPQTEYAKKLRQKQQRYIDKQKERKPIITPENETRIRDLVTQAAFSIRHLNFALDILAKENAIPKWSMITEAMEEFKKMEKYFETTEGSEGFDWNIYENFIWNFLNHTPEKKERIMRFAESLWNKKH